MKTVDKAMGLLRQFSLEQPEIGLNDLARLCDEDKATVRRILMAMMKHDFVEQNSENKKYRLGHGFLALAHLRAATMPVHRVAAIMADWLAAKSDETVHVGFAGKTGLNTIAYSLPRRGNIINLKPAETYPYHASCSGIAYLSFCTSDRQKEILGYPRQKLTRYTPVDEDELWEIILETRQRGYACTRHTVEIGVASVAMPFFSNETLPAGTVAITIQEADMTDQRRDALAALLWDAVEKLEIAISGHSRLTGNRLQP